MAAASAASYAVPPPVDEPVGHGSVYVPPQPSIPASQPIPQQPQTHARNMQVNCSVRCENLLRQIEATYPRAHTKTNDIFVTLALRDLEAPSPHATQVEVHSIAQSLACWGLSRNALRLTENQFALREASLFLTSLEQAAYHLEKALAVASITAVSAP